MVVRGGVDFRASVEEVVRRIREVADPEKIILFGSSVREGVGDPNDIDVLVVKEVASRNHLTECIYRALLGVGRAVDVIVVTPGDVAQYRTSRILVIGKALSEGKVVYAA